MQFVNQFVVPAPVAEAWALLCDVPRIAPCLPGASVRQTAEDQYEGTVSVKVGPIKVGYAGVAAVTERDPDRHVMVVEAQGRESSGRGSAAAVIRLELLEKGSHSALANVTTELQITGKVAQFGRSALADVGQRILDQFSQNLAALRADTRPGPQREDRQQVDRVGSTSERGNPRKEHRAAEPAASDFSGELDAVALLLPSLRRAAPIAAGVAAGLLLGSLLRLLRSGARAGVGIHCGATSGLPSLRRPWPGCKH